MIIEIGVNTRYIMKIERLDFNHDHFDIADTLIVMEPNASDNKPNLIYSKETYSTIKGKITRAQKVRDD